MELSRRGLLGGILAAGCAPLIVRAGVLMPVKPGLLLPVINGGTWADLNPRNLFFNNSTGTGFTVYGTDVYGIPIVERVEPGTGCHGFKEVTRVIACHPVGLAS